MVVFFIEGIKLLTLLYHMYWFEKDHDLFIVKSLPG